MSEEWYIHNDLACPHCQRSKYVIIADAKDYRLCRCLVCNAEFLKLKHKRGNGYE